MRRALPIRLARRHELEVIQEFMPKTRIEEMKRCVFHSPVVPIYSVAHKIFQIFLRSKFFVVFRISVAQEIPGTPRPVWHSIRLPSRFAFTLRAFNLNPGLHSCERTL